MCQRRYRVMVNVCNLPCLGVGDLPDRSWDIVPPQTQCSPVRSGVEPGNIASGLGKAKLPDHRTMNHTGEKFSRRPNQLPLLYQRLEVQKEEFQVAKQDFISPLPAQQHGHVRLPLYHLKYAVLSNHAKTRNRFVAMSQNRIQQGKQIRALKQELVISHSGL